MKYIRRYLTTNSYNEDKSNIQNLDFSVSQDQEADLLYVNKRIAIDTIVIDQTVTDPYSMVSGDVNGQVIQAIRSNSHRVLAKKTDEGTVTYAILDDTDSTKYEDGTTAALDGTEGDVFIKLPTFYYKGEASEDYNTIKMYFSLEKPDDTYIEWDGNTLIGAYEAYYGDGKLQSISGVTSSEKISQANFKTYSRARGEGYQLVDWQMHCVIGCLYYAIYGNTNCQATIGSGTDSYTKETGQTNSLGMVDTDSNNGNTMSINFFGLENWWGNKAEFIDDYINEASTLVATVNDPVNGGTRELAIPSAGYNGYHPQRMKFGKYLDLIPTDDDPKASSSFSGYCDYQWWPTTTLTIIRVVRRSNSQSGANGGVAYANANYTPSDSNSVCGSRLAFRGQCIKASSISDFKSLPLL